MITLLLAAALVAQGIATSGATQAQEKPDGEVRITRAVFGAAQKSADVTPIVARLIKQGMDEFYAAPRWLEGDPASGQPKSLVVFYEYQGKPHVLTISDLGAVSEMILIEHADSTMRLRPIAGLSTGVLIVRALYGQGRNFQEVTNVAREKIRPKRPGIVVSDSAMLVPPTTTRESLIITYFYRGTRNTWSASSGARVSDDILVAYAEEGGQARKYSHAPPSWLHDTQPEAALAAGNVGRANRRELAIFDLLKAIAELEAIPATDRAERVTSALVATKKALTDAQLNIGYPFPPENSRLPEAAKASAPAHISNAVRSLTTALNNFGAANTGRARGAGASMSRLTASINEALASLR